MTLAEKIRNDLTEAVKARETLRVGALRMLIASLKNAEIGKRGPLTDDDCLGQINKAIKMRLEAMGAAEKAGRNDIREKEESEMKVLKSYLPEQIGREELESLVAAAVGEAAARGPGDMGKVMKALMPKVAGKADGSAVSQLVREKLSSLQK